MDKLNSLSWNYFKTYQELNKNILFSSNNNNPTINNKN
jgi:hypothetical protein